MPENRAASPVLPVLCRDRRVGKWTWVVLLAWLALGVAAAGATHLPGIDRAFVGWEGWVSSHFATMARSFGDQGVVALGGAPIQNNPPLGVRPDAYVHWPPLFPILLSGVFAVFGESEAVARGLMLAILAAEAALIYAIMSAFRSRAAGLLAAAAALVMPVVLQWGLTVLHLQAAVVAALASVWCFVKATSGGGAVAWRWAGTGAAATAVGVGLSWEAALVPPGLLLAGLCRRRRGELAVAGVYIASAFAAGAGIIALYYAEHPHMIEQLAQTALWRTGLTDFAPDMDALHSLMYEQVRGEPRPGLGDKLVRLREHGRLIGMVPVIALACLVLAGIMRRRAGRDGLFPVVLGLVSPCVLWGLLMSNHWYYHPYQMLLAVPVFAIAVGASAEAVLRTDLRKANWLCWLLGAVCIPMVLMQGARPWALGDAGVRPATTERVEHARQIARLTPPGSVVLSPETNLVIVYYSRRHVIRGVRDDATVAKALPLVLEALPGCEVYLALMPHSHDTARFAAALGDHRRVFPWLILAPLGRQD